MSDPQTWWLNVTNILMGGSVLLFALLVAAGALYEAFRHHAGSHIS
jgi:hypothetical protein